MPRRGPARLGLGEAAIRGAAAGLASGAAMLVAERIAERRLAGPRRGRSHSAWSELIGEAADRLGVELDARGERVAETAAHLAFSTVMGALYGMAQSRIGPNEPEQGLLDAGLVYAAFLGSRAAAPRRVVRGRGRAKGMARLAVPLTGQSVLGTGTAALFGALARLGGR